MRRTLLVSLAVVVLLALGSFPMAGASRRGARGRRSGPARAKTVRWGDLVPAPPASSPVDAVPGEVVVQLRAGTGRAGRLAAARRVGGRVGSFVPDFAVETLRIPGRDTVVGAIRRLLRDPAVRYAEPNYRRHVQAPPNDELFGDQWGSSNTGQAHVIEDPPPATASGTSGADVSALAAWARQLGDPGAIVAVIDTGVQTDQPDLANQLTAPNTWRDFKDGDHHPDPVHNWPSAADWMHGTHVAGIVAAERDNMIGVSGICPGCRVMPIRFALTVSSEVKAISWAVDHGADVINASFGGGAWSGVERSAIRRAGKRGVLFVAAAGNSSLDNDVPTFDSKGRLLSPLFPSSYELPTILSVAASNDKDRYGYFTGCASPAGSDYSRGACQFSSFGRTSVDLAAPGVDIMSTVVPGHGSYPPSGPTADDFDSWNGTSMSTPMAAGVAALVASQHPGYSPMQLKNAVMNGADHPHGLHRLVNPLTVHSVSSGKFASGRFTVTNGRVDARAALSSSTRNATPRSDGTLAGARRLKHKAHGSVRWPSDPTDVFRSRLKKGTWDVRIARKGPSSDLWVLKPGIEDLWQFSSGCFGAGKCPIIGLSTSRRSQLIRFKAREPGRYTFAVSDFYSGRSRYKLRLERVGR
jgi:subtilisin family serine protease